MSTTGVRIRSRFIVTGRGFRPASREIRSAELPAEAFARLGSRRMTGFNLHSRPLSRIAATFYNGGPTEPSHRRSVFSHPMINNLPVRTLKHGELTIEGYS